MSAHQQRRSLLALLPLLLIFLPVIAAYVPANYDDPILPPEGCTTIAVSRGASATGPMTTHTNDCKDCDFRLSLVPRKSHKKRATRSVPPVRFTYPRYVGDDRGPTLTLENVDLSIREWNVTDSVGSIEQVHETYQYIDGNYGIMNEHGVAIGESTCAAKLVAKPVYDDGTALFEISELTRIALERAKTAREAVTIIGTLAERYGYYGAEWDGDYAKGEAGEALTITDSNEAWVMHITPDDTGYSAVWVAQRVPDGHFAVIANAFSIQRINLTQSNNFLASENIYGVARRLGWFNHSDTNEFNFARVYGSRVSFEEYCSRRVWRAYTMVNPSLHHSLKPNMTVLDLPFSVPVDEKLTVHDLMRIQRDHYEGTPYDLTQGMAAGPYGNPNRYDRGEASGMPMSVLMQGTFERPISMFRTSYSFVSESRPSVDKMLAARLWFAPSIPHASFYSPLYVNSLALPQSLTVGSLYQYDESSAWWLVTAVANWMERMFAYISIDVRRVQNFTELHLDRQIAAFEQSLSDNDHDRHCVSEALTEFQQVHTANVTDRWHRLFHHLIAKYHDGYRIDSWHDDNINPTALFYPYDWLVNVGFFGRPGLEPDWNKTSWSYTTDHDEHFVPAVKLKMSKERHQRSSSTGSSSLTHPHLSGDSDNRHTQHDIGGWLVFGASNAVSLFVGIVVGVMLVRYTGVLGADGRGRYEEIRDQA